MEREYAPKSETREKTIRATEGRKKEKKNTILKPMTEWRRKDREKKIKRKRVVHINVCVSALKKQSCVRRLN